MSNPLVSCIVPSFNNGKFLQQAIDSVRNQKYRPIEICVADNCSTDETKEVLVRNATGWDETGYRLIYKIERDFNIGSGFNQGLKMVTGKYISELMTDDFYEPDVFQVAIDILEKTGVAMVSGGYRIVHENGEPMKGECWDYGRQWRPWTCKSLLDKMIAVFQPTIFARADYVKGLGGMSESLFFTQDKDLWAKLIVVGGIEFIKEPTIIANWRSHNFSTSVKLHKSQEEEAAYLYSNWQMYENNRELLCKLAGVT